MLLPTRTRRPVLPSAKQVTAHKTTIQILFRWECVGNFRGTNLSLECPVHCKQNTLLRTILYYFYKRCSKRAGICTSLPYRNFFLFLNFIPARIFKPCKVPTKIYILPCAHKYVPHANHSRPWAVRPTVWEPLT
jgi:hypothetical protein